MPEKKELPAAGLWPVNMKINVKLLTWIDKAGAENERDRSKQIIFMVKKQAKIDGFTE